LDCSVIVADNASIDGSLDMLKAEFPEVETIVLDQNYGFADGYNRALRQVDAEYYLLLNSDVEIRQEGWLVPMVKYMDEHPDCAVCQPKLMALRNPDEFEYAGAAGGFLDKYGYPFCRGRIFGVVEKDGGQYDECVPLLWATGAALMVRSKDYWEAGGLDGRFFAHMEEIDLCWRLRTMGRAIVCIAESTAYHLGGATLNQGNPRKTFLNFRNNLLMLYKNLPEDELKSVMRMRWWLDMLAAMQFLAKFDFANFKAVLRANREFRRMKPGSEADRQLNLSRRKIKGRVPERCDFSILWQYYAKGKKTYQEL
jgi:GT2 family glycosyltransferase